VFPQWNQELLSNEYAVKIPVSPMCTLSEESGFQMGCTIDSMGLSVRTSLVHQKKIRLSPLIEEESKTQPDTRGA